MPNITLSIPDEIKQKMDEHPHVKWSNVVRSVILQKLSDFEEAERLARKSKLTMADVEQIAVKVNRAMAKHAEALLNERHSRR